MQRKKIVKEADFNRLYKMQPNGMVKKKSTYYNFSQKFYYNLIRWLNIYTDFNTFATYRPKMTKITGFNAPELFEDVLIQLKNIKELFWVIEGDWNGNSNHCHLLINCKGIDKTNLAEAMNRGSKEILYWQPIKNKKDAVNYCTKYIKGKSIRAYEYLIRDKQIETLENEKMLNTYSHSFTKDFHPNKEYFRKQQVTNELFYGSFSNRVIGKEKEPVEVWNYTRKAGLKKQMVYN